MIDSGNRTEYFLFFATNSDSGLSKMKQAMWHADPTQGQSFSDFTDPNQMVLIDAASDPVSLRNLLTKHFKLLPVIPCGMKFLQPAVQMLQL